MENPYLCHSIPIGLPLWIVGRHTSFRRFPHMRTLAQSAHDLAAGVLSSRSLVEECLARILDPTGEGRRVFLKVHTDQARAAADYIDTMRRAGAAPSRFAGIPISVKDLFDIAGDVTTAGS